MSLPGMVVWLSIPALYAGYISKDRKLTQALTISVLEGDVIPLNLHLPATDLNNSDEIISLLKSRFLLIIIIIPVLLISGGENRYKVAIKQLSDDIDWVKLVQDYNPPVDS